MEKRYINELVHETSPYLLQHAHNPVDWVPWGDKAFTLAREENKLLIISIGYSSCHWCHVMERESFTDEKVAGLMNKHFICVKVDREERPDVDQVYMNAAFLVTGSGGWPLNVVALPDGQPVFAGTYFPKENWISLLEYFTGLHEKQPEFLKERAGSIRQGLYKMEDIPEALQPRPFTANEIRGFTRSLMNNIDFQHGGTRGAPKFPMPGIYTYLLHDYALNRDEEILKAVNITLKKMAMGGIYDHVGGGFARYSVDERWFAPHFEKMLYDNAQLVSLYAKAFQLTKDPLYKSIVYDTAGFIAREMTSAQGGFYSALDADSEGIEGKFYTWARDEVDQVLGKDADLFSKHFNISKEGNWEQNQNILFLSELDVKLILAEKMISLKKQMLDARSARTRPGLDIKVLTSWNALMLNAYVDAYRVFDDPVFKNRAFLNASFIEREMIQDDSSIMRNYMNDTASINGFLDDYAFTISAFINLYQASFEEKWLQLANELALYCLDHFYDPSSRLFYYTSDTNKALILRSKELSDNVIPSSNSVMAKNLFFLGTFYEKRDYIEKAFSALGQMKEKMIDHPSFHTSWGQLMLYMSNAPYEVVIMGKDARSYRAAFDRHFLPQVIFAGGEEEGSLGLLKGRLSDQQMMIYVCRNNTCKLPVSAVDEAMKQLQG